MTSPWTIHRIDTSNTTLLANVASEVFDEPVEGDLLAAFLGQEGGRVLVVACSEGIVVAQCTAFIHVHPGKPPSLYIDELATAEEHRRRGIARALVHEAEAWGAERGCTTCWLATEPDNVEASALYVSLPARAVPAKIFEWHPPTGGRGLQR